jgi:arylsulfatase A-like enzyme
MFDDMGFGDLSPHGSPFIKTPHLDALHGSGARLTDFHVAPMCSPTRGQLLTGRDALRNGSSIVASSRMMVRAGVPMLGKWHLGENHPHRPQDRGWQTALWFPLQEISSLSDHWGNDYFDPVLRRADGRTEKFAGYCIRSTRILRHVNLRSPCSLHPIPSSLSRASCLRFLSPDWPPPLLPPPSHFVRCPIHPAAC